MNWVQLAFGLIKEAVTTEQGREVINNVRSAVRRDTPEPAAPAVDVYALLAQQRTEIDKNLDTIVQMLNAQNERFLHTIHRLRIWNAALTAGLVVALLFALLAYF
jgi:hypothetical protein